MFLDVERSGTIHHPTAGTAWSAAELAAEVARRAQALATNRIGSGSVVAIAHGGSAAFFADLFAVWSLGAAAACLDPALTPSERENVVAFCKPRAVLYQDPAALEPGAAETQAAGLDNAAPH